jgi:xylan 1,4-beta-xylosidase
MQRIDDDHGNVLRSYKKMGSPLDPTAAQVEQMNQESALPGANSSAQLEPRDLTPNALVLIKVEP